MGVTFQILVKILHWFQPSLLSSSPLPYHLHLRQDIVDEAVLDEVEVDQLVLQLDDPPDGRVQQLSQQQPFDDGGERGGGGDDDEDDGDPPVI